MLRDYYSLRLRLAQNPDDIQAVVPVTPLRRLQEAHTRGTPTPTSVPPERVKRPQTNRKLVSHMAWLTDEQTKASDEKLSIAQSMVESVRS